MHATVKLGKANAEIVRKNHEIEDLRAKFERKNKAIKTAIGLIESGAYGWAIDELEKALKTRRRYDR